MKYHIHSEQFIHEAFFKIREAKVTFDRYDGKDPFPVCRSVIDKGPAVAVILHLQDIDKYVFVEQFRYPMTLIDGQEPWMLEVVAGVIDDGYTARETALKELKEEAGFIPESIELIQDIYPSPGIMSEKISLFYAEGNSSSTIESGDPHDEEEDVRVVKYGLNELAKLVNEGWIKDAKTIIAIQYVLLKRFIE